MTNTITKTESRTPAGANSAEPLPLWGMALAIMLDAWSIDDASARRIVKWFGSRVPEPKPDFVLQVLAVTRWWYFENKAGRAGKDWVGGVLNAIDTKQACPVLHVAVARQALEDFHDEQEAEPEPKPAQEYPALIPEPQTAAPEPVKPSAAKQPKPKPANVTPLRPTSAPLAVTANAPVALPPMAVDVVQAAQMLAVHPETIRREIRAGNLKAFRIGRGRSWRIRIGELQGFLKRLESESAHKQAAS